MKLEYPLFILLDDLSLKIANTPADLDWYERIDIEEYVHIGWDINGVPLKLVWDQKDGIIPKATREQPQLDKLKEAICEYARSYRKDISFVYPGDDNNIIELYNAVDKFIKEGCKRNSFVEKIKSFFKRK